MIYIIVIMIRRFDNSDHNYRVENMHILLVHSNITIVMVCWFKSVTNLKKKTDSKGGECVHWIHEYVLGYHWADTDDNDDGDGDVGDYDGGHDDDDPDVALGYNWVTIELALREISWICPTIYLDIKTSRHIQSN